MPVFRDRVKDTSTSTGSGNITLSGAPPSGYQSFNTAFGLGTPFPYCIANETAGQWETGVGYLSAATTFVRDSVADGSSGVGVTVNFSAGTKDVFCTVISHWCEDTDTGAMLHRAWNMALP